MSEITSTSHNNYCRFAVSNALNQMSNLCLSQPNYNLSLPIRAVIRPYFRHRRGRRKTQEIERVQDKQKDGERCHTYDWPTCPCGEQLCSSNNSSLSLCSGIYSTAVCLCECIHTQHKWAYNSTIHIGTNIRHHYWIYSTAVCLCACTHTQHKHVSSQY